ncbi:uncharacterized protein LOC117647165 isoform X2 [Thrips palmi]|uniref:Uncharacterized protein LOC117647165 isoform X2 n=1 Tax=Thrips palmi TaxID=161013 RepID=A0A6P8YWW0_THRPL|nr:uncharacterized protein LOC117647165 isoform X2 [Thrips palmi]
MSEGSAALRASWLGRIMAQARLRNMQCPLVWTTAASFDGVLEDKLRDLVTLAPSAWDAVVRDLVRVSRMMHTSTGSLDDIKATLSRCFELVHRPRRTSPSDEPCAIVDEYRTALLHALDTTFLMVACVFDRKNLEEVPATEHVPKYESMDVKTKSAIWAIRAQVKLTCYLGTVHAPVHGLGTDEAPVMRPPSLMDALLAASRAKDMLPSEGHWKALYGDMLPDDNPRKLTLLRNAARARRSPFTLTCLSRYLYKLGDHAAFDLCADALVEWPRSVHANVSYVLMYLSCSVPGKLSRCLAEQCLLRLQRLTPACVFVQGLALQLRLQAAEENSYLGGGDAGGVAPLRPRPFSPTDHEAIHKALEMYVGDGEPWSMVRREPCGRVQLDKCNCVCSGDCAYLTYKEHGTLLAGDKPLACYAE